MFPPMHLTVLPVEARLILGISRRQLAVAKSKNLLAASGTHFRDLRVSFHNLFDLLEFHLMSVLRMHGVDSFRHQARCITDVFASEIDLHCTLSKEEVCLILRDILVENGAESAVKDGIAFLDRIENFFKTTWAVE